MSAPAPVGYTYEADTHCPACAEARFGPDREGTDSEGNEVGAIFPWDLSGWVDDAEYMGEPWRGLACGTCREVFTR